MIVEWWDASIGCGLDVDVDGEVLKLLNVK